MPDQNSSLGLAGWGVYLPPDRLTAAQLAGPSGLTEDRLIELGLTAKAAPGPEDQPITMAARAGRLALERAGIDPAEVDVVIWTGEEYKDFIAQTASIRLQEECGCQDAWAFDLVGQGTTSLLGLRLAQDLAVGDRDVNTILLAGGTRNIDLVDPANPDTRFLLAASASGGALVLKRGWPANRLRSAAVETDPDLADQVKVPGGGTEIPFAPDNLDSPLMFYQVQDPGLVADYLAGPFIDRLIGIGRRVLDGGRADYLALRHLPPAQRLRVLAGLGVAEDRSVGLAELGHHGTNDPIISLGLALDRGLITDGSVVALAAAGIGFTYAGAVFDWGPAA